MFCPANHRVEFTENKSIFVLCNSSALKKINLMSVNKNALIRYKVLDRCFRNAGRQYFWEDLLDECNKALRELDPSNGGIQRRQLFDDIRFMESEHGWSVPLDRIRHGRKVHYRYEDLSFSISNQPLNDSEAEQIKSALQIISRFSGTPQFEWVDEMIPMLESKFQLKEREKEIICFESNIDLEGRQFITPLFNAIINQRVLQINYKDFKSPEAYDVIFHPYYLKQFNNRWFVFGLNANNSISTWNMALDRIQSINELDLNFIVNEIDWEEDYFYDIIGVTRILNSEIIEVVLQFTSDLAPYIQTKPIHPTQTKPKFLESGEMVISIKVIPNYELERLIISYGAEVKVISPKSIRDKIQSKIQEMFNLYFE